MTLLVENRGLLRDFRTGAPAALREVFLRYAPEVAQFLRRGFTFRVGERQVRFAGYREVFAVEDALQEVFRRAFSDNARSSYDGLRPFRAYLLTIAKNAVINEFHARRRQLDQVGFEEMRDVPGGEDYSAADNPLEAAAEVTTGNPERDLQSRELRALVTEYRRGLAAREAQVFDLRYAEGLSHSDITLRLGLSASKIKTTEERIRKGLLRFMHRHGYFRGRKHKLPGQVGPAVGSEGS
ncbi:MAG: sigma-70 family RNA polymerase sigma factor [Deltaproteobacteria bacterium]|nr:sigma-70 family RNA polymerase sigma factor [Deltaproteobacteria bacterium]